MEFKKLNYINAFKKFCNHFHYIYFYYRHSNMGSQWDNMCFMFTKFIVIVLDCTISFSLWWTMVKMAIYTQNCEQKWLKINNRGSWNKDVLGGKKIEKLTIGGGDETRE